MERYAFVIDYQNSFVDSVLGIPGAEKLDGKIAVKVQLYGKNHVLFLFRQEKDEKKPT